MKAIKAEIDTNVFISGIFFSGPPAKILTTWNIGLIKLSVTDDILEEYRRVMYDLAVKMSPVDLGFYS